MLIVAWLATSTSGLELAVEVAEDVGELRDLRFRETNDWVVVMRSAALLVTAVFSTRGKLARGEYPDESRRTYPRTALGCPGGTKHE